jgi:hypothetical protein
MICTGDEYRDSICDGREAYINGERVRAVTTHPAFKPIVDVRAPFAQLAAVYRNFDWQVPLDVLRYSAGLSEHPGAARDAVGV